MTTDRRDRLGALAQAVASTLEAHVALDDDVRCVLLLSTDREALMLHDYPTPADALPDLLGHVAAIRQAGPDGPTDAHAILYGGQL